MKNTISILLTLLTLTALNFVAAEFLNLAFLDIAVLIGGLAIAISFFFKSKGGMASRHMDMSIQGQTGIRMDHQSAPSEKSYVLIGSVIYTATVLVVTFITFREYFLSFGA